MFLIRGTLVGLLIGASISSSSFGAINTATLVFTDTPQPIDFGSVEVGSYVYKVITVENSIIVGSKTITNMTMQPLTGPFFLAGNEGNQGGYPGVGANCWDSLAPGASCTIAIDFAPSTTGLSSTTIAFTYNNGLKTVSASAVIEGTGVLLGDYTGDGIVDSSDYVLWRTNVGSTTAMPNDVIGGTIGQAQYDQWRSHFGESSAGGMTALGSNSVPEPSALALFGLMSVLTATRRR